MPTFEYRGWDGQGRKASGRVEATGRQAAANKLNRQGIFPTTLQVSGEGRGWSDQLSFRRRVSAPQLAATTRQMATLLRAGLPLDEVLSTIAEQTEQGGMKEAFYQIRDQVIQGEALFEALGQHGRIFPELYINMVQVGESSGTLDEVFHRLADFLDEQAKIRSRIQAALAYPLLMIVVGVAVLAFLFIFVVPKIIRMLEELGQALPWPTKVLITTSDLLSNWWWLLLLLLVAAGSLWHRYRRSEGGRLRTDRLLLRLPLYGRLHLYLATAWFSRTLGTLLNSGVPLLRSLDIAGQLLKNRVLKRAVSQVRLSVQEGGGLASGLRETAVFPPLLAQVTDAGERSGELEAMLFRVADTYDNQTELSINGLLSLLEPVMILVMGSVVGFVVLAILLPIFEASQGF